MERVARAPIAAVGVVCLRGSEVLLVRRGKPPRIGEWSLPGGRIEWGESAGAAALRELAEETGVEARIVGLIDVVDGFFGAGTAPDAHYVLIDYAAVWLSGVPSPGDDATEARFFSLGALGSLGLWAETARVIHAAAAVVARG